MRTACLLGIALAMCPAPAARAADEKEDRERRVRVAIAIAEAEAKAKSKRTPVATAPPPHTPKVPTYDEGHAKAVADEMPLVVYVGCELRKVDGTVGVRVESYPGVDAPAVVVGYPVGGRMYEEKKFPGCPPEKDIATAAEKARKKIEGVQPMPKDKPLPPPSGNFKITAELIAPLLALTTTAAVPPGCACGDSCPCCAAKATASSEVIPPDPMAGYRWCYRGGQWAFHPDGKATASPTPAAVVTPQPAPTVRYGYRQVCTGNGCVLVWGPLP